KVIVSMFDPVWSSAVASEHPFTRFPPELEEALLDDEPPAPPVPPELLAPLDVLGEPLLELPAAFPPVPPPPPPPHAARNSAPTRHGVQNHKTFFIPSSFPFVPRPCASGSTLGATQDLQYRDRQGAGPDRARGPAP